MATNITERTDLSGLIPETVTREIIQGVSQGSAVLQMGRRLPNMTSKTQSMNVLDMLPTAYWVVMQQYKPQGETKFNNRAI